MKGFKPRSDLAGLFPSQCGNTGRLGEVGAEPATSQVKGAVTQTGAPVGENGGMLRRQNGGQTV